MKHISLFLLGFVTLMACNNQATTLPEAAPTEAEQTDAKPEGLHVVTDSVQVDWTAYKTTEKVAVGGTFKEATIGNLQEGSTPQEILNGATLSIPMSSVFSNNEERDGKLRTFFFDKLLGDGSINASMSFENDSAFVSLNFNEVSKKFPVEYTFEDNLFTVNTTLQLAEYKALDALASLHEACYDLHMAGDGVSKTWEDVAVKGTVLFE